MNININTTVGIAPRCKGHEVNYITRGATAVLDFDFTEKVYDFNDIEQLTVILKNNDELLHYDMVQYYALTSDTTAATSKLYYNRIPANKTSSYKFTVAEVNVGESVVGLYEKTELSESHEPDENWQLDEHFSVSEDGQWVNFILTPTETIKFEPTQNMKFEAALRVNTDSLFEQNVDSVIINKYHPIVVVNSLYGEILEG